jgi:hypothetical protein
MKLKCCACCEYHAWCQSLQPLGTLALCPVLTPRIAVVFATLKLCWVQMLQGTQAALEKGGVKCERVLKIQEGRPNAGDMLKNGDISMLMLTTTGKRPPCCSSAAAFMQHSSLLCAVVAAGWLVGTISSGRMCHAVSTRVPVSVFWTAKDRQYSWQVTSRMSGTGRTCDGWPWRSRFPSSPPSRVP